MTKITWGIVATVAEPAPLVLAFVAHHLTLGADEIHLYLDDPDDPVGNKLEGIPNVHITRCDSTYWRGTISHRPKRHNSRQSRNADHAQAACQVAFLLSCDADEFLRPGSDVQWQLAEVPKDRTWTKVFNLERALITDAPRETIFDGASKVYYQGATTTPLRCSELAPMGFTGHAAGKPFVRIRARLNIGIHVPRRGHIKDRKVPPHHPADLIELVHFDGLTPLHWAAKFLRQAANFPERLQQFTPYRIAQWRRVLQCLDDQAELTALFEEVNGHTQSEVDALEDDGHWVGDDFDLRPALAEAFPRQEIERSPEAFDAILAPRVTEWRRRAERNGVL